MERTASRDAHQYRRSPRRGLSRRCPSTVAPQGPRGRLTKRTKLGAIAEAFHDSCLAELDALKPGNVHRLSEDKRMGVADFERSAAAAAPVMGRA
ncbi:MAG TPA: triphosphoribosyl-dephospho-CoA synthase, partial [Methyloceanibacter sp.]|nr:triphosphoribosyl-dephospho-CoA synthase [Methyloceanibacter sp.]